jgi:hypothetical protein
LDKLSKSQFFCATNHFVGKLHTNKKKGHNTPNKLQELLKKGKTVTNCAFLHSKAQTLRNLLKQE